MKRLALTALALALPLSSQAIEPYRAQEITPYQAQEITPYNAQHVKPAQPTEIQPYRATEVKPYAAKPVRPPQEEAKPAERKEKGQEKSRELQTAGARGLVGVWQTNIPGAVYTTPSSRAGYDTLHVSSGVAVGLLRINADGTYSWNSYGGKKGKWVTTTNPEYPLEIIDTVENRRWRVGYNEPKKTLLIWDGTYWYEGRRAKVGKKK